MKKNLLKISLIVFLFIGLKTNAQSLYIDNTVNGYQFNPGIGTSGETITAFDDINVDSAKVAGADTLYITKVKFGILRDVSATPVSVNLYYSTTSSDVNANFFTVPPIFLGTVSLPANGTKVATTYVSIGDSSSTLFKIPISSPKVFVGENTFYLGLNFSTTDASNGWALSTPPNSIYNNRVFWVYDEDTTGLFSFGPKPAPAGSFSVQVFGTTTPNALPVNFTSFNGVLQNNIAALNWSTANESNNKGFNIEKSTDGETFASIGFVAAASPAYAIDNYTFNDAKLISGNNYYRIKQTDLNGNFKYSSIIKLAFDKFDWSISGNGSSNAWMQLQLDKSSTVSVQILSMNGTLINTINKGTIGQGTYSLPLDLSRAASGMYVVKLIVNGQVYSKNMMK